MRCRVLESCPNFFYYFVRNYGGFPVGNRVLQRNECFAVVVKRRELLQTYGGLTLSFCYCRRLHKIGAILSYNTIP